MDRKSLIEQIEDYCPFNEQELMDKAVILNELQNNPDIFTRDSLTGHITVSAWILNKHSDKTLMVYHNIYNSWSWTGGHADGEEDLYSIALKEAKEETGIEHMIDLFDKEIFSLEIIPVSGHFKNGRYVSSHLHYNLTYAFCASEKDELRIKPDENSKVGWIDIDKLSEYCTEPWMVDNIYNKLVDKYKIG